MKRVFMKMMRQMLTGVTMVTLQQLEAVLLADHKKYINVSLFPFSSNGR